MYKSGFIALVGRPNVGKSTLLNALVGEKIAITTNRPQTTRTQIRAVLSKPGCQAVFIDTPGLHKPKHKLGKSMVKLATAAAAEADLVCFLVEAHKKPGPGDKFIAETLQKIKTPVFLIINKTDLTTSAALEISKEEYGKLADFKAIFLLSALQKKDLNPLVGAVCEALPQGPQFYPDDMITDQPERFIVAEIIREKIITLTHEEIPFSFAVVIEEMKDREQSEILDLRAEIFVERKSQVGIIVGKGGLLLKNAGTRARRELEALLGRHIFLDLRVKVKKDWRNREEELRRLGYLHQ